MKKLVKTLIVFLIAIITTALSNSVYAWQSVYKSNPAQYVANRTGVEWMTEIRDMEKSGEVMGLNERRNSTLVPTTGSNNIDVHMQKNTEYGAMILLGASKEYGKQGDGENRYITKGNVKTTTGNVYGVYFDNQYDYTTKTGEFGHVGAEHVAASIGVSEGSSSYNSSGASWQAAAYNFSNKYYNNYSSTSERKNGDALLTWQNGSVSLFNIYGIMRGYQSASAFRADRVSAGYFSTSSTGSGPDRLKSYNTYAYVGNTRAVIVNGDNF